MVPHRDTELGQGACGPGGQSLATWCAQAGTTYHIMVFGFEGGAGPGTLTITDSGTACSVPVNDTCATATVLSSPFPVTGSVNTKFADSAGDPFISCGFLNLHSVWFTVTPTANGQGTFDTCGSDYDTVAAVFSGPCGALNEITCNEDSSTTCSGTTQSSVTWRVLAGTTYLIEVVSHNSDGGNLLYRLDVVGDEVLCRTGNINGGILPITDTLTVNGSVGTTPDREVMITPSTPFTLQIAVTPAGGRKYAMYVWANPPTPSTVRILPRGIGTIGRLTPLNPGDVQPARIANNTGYPQVGTENWPGTPTQEAPYMLLNLPAGIGRHGMFYFQGIQFDPGAPNGLAGVTNGIVVISM
ncbi:MAG: hypothetical protein HYR85_24975 [Planctomycetes bacterium]|nr:hypothetical protein [Planctomycetota bacterium]